MLLNIMFRSSNCQLSVSWKCLQDEEWGAEENADFSILVYSGNPLQYSCLENPMNRGAWWATVHGVAKSWTQLSD